MIHIVTHANRAFYLPQLEAMHERRRRLARTPLGALRKDGVDGRDRYDDEHAVYAMALAGDGALQCCLRIRPTTDRSFMHEFFNAYIDPREGSLQGTDVWAAGRWVTQNPEDGFDVAPGLSRTADVMLAAMEHACRAGATRSVSVTLLANFHRMRAANLNVRKVGPELDLQGVTAVAVESAITPEDIDVFRRSMGRVGWAGYEIDEVDMAVHGTFVEIERAFDRASAAPLLSPDVPELAIAQAERHYRLFG